MAPLLSLTGPIRDARSEADLTAIEEKIDDILKAELAKHAKGERQVADSAALSLAAAQRLEQLIQYRRTMLTAGPAASELGSAAGTIRDVNPDKRRKIVPPPASPGHA